MGSCPRFAPVIATVLLSCAAAAQTPLFTVDGPRLVDSPRLVAGTGDVDRDGFPDFAVSRFSRGQRTRGSVAVVSGRDGTTIFVLRSTTTLDDFGFSVAGAGDVDLDGHGDVIVGAPLAAKNGTGAGAAFVFSGRTGRVIREFDGDRAGDMLGFAVAGAGDVNLDGRADLVAGAPGAGKARGMVRVFDGFSGRILYTLHGASLGDRLGTTVDLVGDADLDGHADFAAGAPRAPGKGGGRVIVWSGKWGTVLRTLGSTSSTEPFGDIVAGVGDTDGDGHADIAVAANNSFVPSVRVFSGKTGNVLFEFRTSGVTRHVLSIDAAGDVDRDGRDDVLFATDEAIKGKVWILSGKDRSVLWTFTGVAIRNDRIPLAAAAGVGDVDRDGVPDVAVSEHLHPVLRFGSPLAYVFGVGSDSLRVTNPQLSLANGGTAIFHLDGGLAHGGQPYLLLGSRFLAGFPGLAFGPIRFPLLMKGAYFDFTLTNPNVPPLIGSVGFLNAAGRGIAAFRLPARTSSALFGLELHHAFVALGPRPIEFASKPVTIKLVN